MSAQTGKWREDQILIVCPGSLTTMAQLGCGELTPPVYRIPTRMFRDDDTDDWRPYYTYRRQKTTNGATNGDGDDDDWEYVEDPDSTEGAIYPIEGGRIVNMEAFLAFLEHVHGMLTTTYHNTPIMLMASPQWTRPDCEAIARYTFEKTKTPALCLINSGVATQYGLKWPHMTVVDVGYEKVDVTCIYDSKIVNHMDLGHTVEGGPDRDISGGEVFTQKLMELLREQDFSHSMAEQLKKSTVCEVLPYVPDHPKLMDLPFDSEYNDAQLRAAESASRRAGITIDGANGEDKGADNDGVLDVATIVTSGQTKEFLAKKEREKAEKSAKSKRGRDRDAEAAKPARLPNSKKARTVFHYEELVARETSPELDDDDDRDQDMSPAADDEMADETELGDDDQDKMDDAPDETELGEEQDNVDETELGEEQDNMDDTEPGEDDPDRMDETETPPPPEAAIPTPGGEPEPPVQPVAVQPVAVEPVANGADAQAGDAAADNSIALKQEPTDDDSVLKPGLSGGDTSAPQPQAKETPEDKTGSKAESGDPEAPQAEGSGEETAEKSEAPKIETPKSDAPAEKPQDDVVNIPAVVVEPPPPAGDGQQQQQQQQEADSAAEQQPQPPANTEQQPPAIAAGEPPADARQAPTNGDNGDRSGQEGAMSYFPSGDEPSPAQAQAQVAAADTGPQVKKMRHDIEVGLERFTFADRHQVDRIVSTVYRAIQGIDDMYMRPACWESIVFVGNGCRIRGLKENILQTLMARHLISPSSATIFSSELPSNIATPSGTGAQTPTGNFNAPPHQLPTTSSSVNPLLQAATTASLTLPGGINAAGGPNAAENAAAAAAAAGHSHHFHSQTPTAIKLAQLPNYLGEWSKNGFEESMFLGAQVAARLAFCIHNLDAQGLESQKMMSLNRVDYNELGPKGVRTHSMLG